MRDELISEVVQRMLPYLDNKQLVNLQNNLNQVLQKYDVELIKGGNSENDNQELVEKFCDKLFTYKDEIAEKIGEDAASEFDDIVTELKYDGPCSIDQFNYMLNDLYDFCDNVSIWLETRGRIKASLKKKATIDENRKDYLIAPISAGWDEYQLDAYIAEMEQSKDGLTSDAALATLSSALARITSFGKKDFPEL